MGTRDGKQNQLSKALPSIKAMFKTHYELIESEKAKLHRTSDRVQSLEADHANLLEELQQLRKSQDLNRGYWKGMTRGLQAANKTMNTEGDGETVSSVTQFRNALPQLTDLARPASSMN